MKVKPMTNSRAFSYAQILDMIGFLSHTSQDDHLSETLVQSKEFQALNKKLRRFPFTEREESA